jgi:hypothetical protein
MEEPDAKLEEPEEAEIKSRGDPFDSSSLKSIKAVWLDDDAHIFQPGKKYGRDDLIIILEKMVGGINHRESLKARYDEEITRLSINNQRQVDKLHRTKQRLDFLLLEEKNIGLAFKESADKVSRNFLQLTRERKRLAGAVDLREDFDKYLQVGMGSSNKLVFSN